MLYLKIENQGVCPVEGFTIFGASSKNENFQREDIIGTFGSGAKHGVALALRQGVMPVIYCSNTKLAFYTKPLVIKGVNGETQHQRLCVKVSGRTDEGKSINQDRELDHTLSYGCKDWQELALAIREFISNAIDACYEQNLSHENVTVELVEENQVRAKSGFTRIFVPASMEVQRFYAEIDKWFLHFKESENLKKDILQKRQRNAISLDGEKTSAAVIYRRGVRVREYKSSSLPSLFDYNIPNLEIDESRTIDDFKARYECGQALQKTKDIEVMTKLIQALFKNEMCWELTQDDWSLTRNIYLLPQENKDMWRKVFHTVCGDKAVITSKHFAKKIEEKGCIPVVCSDYQEGIYKFLRELNIPNDTDVLTVHDKNDRVIVPLTNAVVETFNCIWQSLEDINMLFGRDKPELCCFRQMNTSASVTMGLWHDNKIYVNVDYADSTSNALYDIVLEEIAHHVTQATDGSREFANYLISITREMVKRNKTSRIM